MNPQQHTVSNEQMTAIQHILHGENVVLDAVAGSGKSTTILSMAKMMPDKQILQLAYNAMLRKEIETKIKRLEITNVKVHTFHSLAVKYYLETAHTDTGIRKIISGNLPAKTTIRPFQVIVLDEAQDMSFLYYQLMVKFTMDMGTPFQLLILGDYMQGIYEFKGADIRALTYASTIWKTHPLLLSPIFHECTLRTSYRITTPMARFINDVMLGDERLVAKKTGESVVYIRNKRKNLEAIVISHINALISEGASPNDFFVLGTSVKGLNSNIRKLENVLVERKIPCYVPTFETEGIDDKVIDGKVVFSTFHSVKGRERKYVFVMGFDQSYFQIASGLSPHTCPNTLYVACTRATHKLFLLEKDDFWFDRPLEFLKKTHIQMRDEKYVEFNGVPRSIFYAMNPAGGTISSSSSEEKELYHEVYPTDLVKYIPDHILEAISPLLDAIFIQEVDPSTQEEIQIPNMICTQKGLYEDVCDLNGIAIPSMYYDHLYKLYAEEGQPVCIGASILKQVITECMQDTKPYEYIYLKKMIEDAPDICYSPADYLQLANLFIAAKERLLFKLTQIELGDYTWLTDEMVEMCLRRLDDAIGAECENSPPLIEHPIIQRDMDAETARMNQLLGPYLPTAKRKFRFSARADLITCKCIWELKCTSSITVEHKLQLVLYDWLWRIVNTPDMASLRKEGTCVQPRIARLINIKTGEILRLNASLEDLTIIVVELLKGKYTEEPPKTTEEFLHECKQYMEKRTETKNLEIL